jgi:hypothetical protein
MSNKSKSRCSHKVLLFVFLWGDFLSMNFISKAAASAHPCCHIVVLQPIYGVGIILGTLIFMGIDEMQCAPAVTMFIKQLPSRKSTPTPPPS